MFRFLSSSHKPLGLKWRSSVWFVTLVVGYGVATDIFVYSVIIPVIPFQLERLGYSNVSGLTGWLLFAFAAGLVLSTPPIAILSEKYRSRRTPLLLGLMALIGSMVMFMEAPKYWVMVLARLLQGFSSSIVWIAALALLCDTTAEQKVGQQLGLAMSGLTLGLVIGPPIGGALYDHLGFRAPFIFGIGTAVLDGVGRLLVIERGDSLKWGHDPTVFPDVTTEVAEGSSNPSEKVPVENTAPPYGKTGDSSTTKELFQDTMRSPDMERPSPRLTPLAVLLSMTKSSRTLAATLCTFIFGVGLAGLEPTLPLRLQAVWNLDSSKVGLIYIAYAVPSVFASPLAGWYADRHGTEWVTVLFLLLSLPWWVILIIRWHLALFIAAFAIIGFFMSGVVSPLMAELASISRTLPGVGFAHVYGAFNLSYGLGSAVGPVVAGQIYDHVQQGWIAVCGIIAGLVLVACICTFWYTGERPLLERFMCKFRQDGRPSNRREHGIA